MNFKTKYVNLHLIQTAAFGVVALWSELHSEDGEPKFRSRKKPEKKISPSLLTVIPTMADELSLRRGSRFI